MDLSKYTSEELQRLKRDIDKELASRRTMDLKEAQKELKSVAERYGFSLTELVSEQPVTLAPTTGQVWFRHPRDSHKIWSGRGRKPVWVKEWEASGHSLDELRVSQE